MDDPNIVEPPAGGRRSFKLTPKQARPDAKPSTASRRNLLIGGSAAMPFITTIRGRAAFAGGQKVTASMAASAGGGKKSSIAAPSGDTVAIWRQNYPKLMESHRLEARAFPAAVTGNRYLSNPALASVFTVPEKRIDGVTFTAPDADLHAALHGHGTWEISVRHKGETARRTMDGGLFAEATAAVLNAALYGEKSFGLNDARVIEQVNQKLASLPVKARALAALKADASAEDILGQLAAQIEGSFATQGEIHYFARLNTRGVA